MPFPALSKPHSRGISPIRTITVLIHQTIYIPSHNPAVSCIHAQCTAHHIQLGILQKLHFDFEKRWKQDKNYLNIKVHECQTLLCWWIWVTWSEVGIKSTDWLLLALVQCTQVQVLQVKRVKDSTKTRAAYQPDHTHTWLVDVSDTHTVPGGNATTWCEGRCGVRVHSKAHRDGLGNVLLTNCGGAGLRPVRSH